MIYSIYDYMVIDFLANPNYLDIQMLLVEEEYCHVHYQLSPLFSQGPIRDIDCAYMISTFFFSQSNQIKYKIGEAIERNGECY